MEVEQNKPNFFLYVRALLRRYGLERLLEDEDTMGRLYKVFMEVFTAGYVRGREDCFSVCVE